MMRICCTCATSLLWFFDEITNQVVYNRKGFSWKHIKLEKMKRVSWYMVKNIFYACWCIINFVSSSLLATWRQKYHKCKKCVLFGMATSKSLNYFKSFPSITCWWILICNSKRYLKIIFQGKIYERTILRCVSANTVLRSIKKFCEIVAIQMKYRCKYKWNLSVSINHFSHCT